MRESILEGLFAQGERINEVQVSRRLGISRGPLREALRRLEQDGLVTSSPNRGTTIIQVTAKDALDLLNVRRLLEPYAVSEALRRRRGDLAKLAEEAYAQMRKAATSGDGSREATAHSNYHGLFYEHSGNRVLARLWTRLEDPVRLFLQLRQTSPAEMLEVASTHQQLIELLAVGDTASIRSEVLAHLDVSLRGLRHLVARRTALTKESTAAHGDSLGPS
jgi:DNA-binding GntR family transcriptional regulator